MKKSEETKIETILEKEEEGEFIHELTSGKVYEQSKEVYSNNFSTAVTFISFSIIGLLVLVLNDLKVFKFLNVSGAQGIVTHLSFIIVFGICLIIGLKSLKIANKAKKNIESEEKNDNEINEFLKNNYSIELIDKECDLLQIMLRKCVISIVLIFSKIKSKKNSHQLQMRRLIT